MQTSTPQNLVEFLDQRLKSILEDVRLVYLLEREGGWDASANWEDMLSLGEQQRLGMVVFEYPSTGGLQYFACKHISVIYEVITRVSLVNRSELMGVFYLGRRGYSSITQSLEFWMNAQSKPPIHLHAVNAADLWVESLHFMSLSGNYVIAE